MTVPFPRMAAGRTYLKSSTPLPGLWEPGLASRAPVRSAVPAHARCPRSYHLLLDTEYTEPVESSFKFGVADANQGLTLSFSVENQRTDSNPWEFSNPSTISQPSCFRPHCILPAPNVLCVFLHPSGVRWAATGYFMFFGSPVRSRFWTSRNVPGFGYFLGQFCLSRFGKKPKRLQNLFYLKVDAL